MMRRSARFAQLYFPCCAETLCRLFANENAVINDVQDEAAPFFGDYIVESADSVVLRLRLAIQRPTLLMHVLRKVKKGAKSQLYGELRITFENRIQRKLKAYCDTYENSSAHIYLHPVSLDCG